MILRISGKNGYDHIMMYAGMDVRIVLHLCILVRYGEYFPNKNTLLWFESPCISGELGPCCSPIDYELLVPWQWHRRRHWAHAALVGEHANKYSPTSGTAAINFAPATFTSRFTLALSSTDSPFFFQSNLNNIYNISTTIEEKEVELQGRQ